MGKGVGLLNSAEFGRKSQETSQMANFYSSQWKNKIRRKHALFDDDLNLYSSIILSGQNFPSCLAVCLFVGVCLFIFEPQCWVGLGHRGFCSGVGGLCFLQLGALSLVCLSWAAGQAVIIQTGLWTGCCVVPLRLGLHPTHIHTLSRSNTHTTGTLATIYTYTTKARRRRRKKRHPKIRKYVQTQVSTEMHNNTSLITTK